MKGQSTCGTEVPQFLAECWCGECDSWLAVVVYEAKGPLSSSYSQLGRSRLEYLKQTEGHHIKTEDTSH